MKNKARQKQNASEKEPQVFRVSMPGNYKAIFIPLLIAAVSGLAVAHHMGETWTAIIIFALTAPIALLFVYALFVVPARIRITLKDDGILLKAPPYFRGVILYDEITDLYPVDMTSEDHPQALFTPKVEVDHGMKRLIREPPRQKKYRIKIGTFRAGIFTLRNDRVALVLTNKNMALCVETSDNYLLLGPDDFEAFVRRLASHVKKKGKKS